MSVAESEGDQRVFCNACQVFADGRAHYREQWHRYNVKRRCNDLAPIAKELFEAKLTALKRRQGEQDEEDEEQKRAALRCTVCSKQFKSAAALATHLRSKKHQKAAELLTKRENQESEQEAVAGESEMQELHDEDEQEGSECADDEAADSEEETRMPIPLGTCLICEHDFADDREGLLRHMAKKHNFVVPFIDRVVDLDGLLTYLGIKLGVGYACLHCSREFEHPVAVRQHMEGKAHFSLDWENNEDEDIDAFYDFSPDLPEDESRAVVAMNEHDELVRADGTVIGMRRHVRYYRQNVRSAEAESRRAARIREAMQERALLTLPGYVPEEHFKEHKRVAAVRQARAQQWQLRVATRNNMAKTKHFRLQCPM
ncbi:MAG: hypothetical protein MHM6MM_007913 [Cercozoa sp. M6MM]